MKLRKLVLTIVLVLSAGYFLSANQLSSLEQYQKFEEVQKKGNFKDALEGYLKILKSDEPDGKLLSKAFNRITVCLQKLGRYAEIDSIRDEAIEKHAKNWRFLQAAAKSLFNGNHYGSIVAGKFIRGNRRGRAENASAANRDRVRGLQLFAKAESLIPQGTNQYHVSIFYDDYANAIKEGRLWQNAWRFQILTDLKTIPDYERGYNYYRSYGTSDGAPVDKEGKPVFYSVPESFEKAVNDGERWRWLLSQQVKYNPEANAKTDYNFAEFLKNQFSVTTLKNYGSVFRKLQTDNKNSEGSPYEVHTLKDTETLCKLATGIKRITLPDEFNFIKIYQNLTKSDNQTYAKNSLLALAQVYENRRQFPKAAEYWKRYIKVEGEGPNKSYQKRLDQIIKNWGQFETVKLQPSGKSASVEFRFRNANEVQLEAYEIKVEKLLTDVMNYLRSNPRKITWDKTNISDIGRRLVYENEKQYLGERVASWKEELKPKKDHFDSRITIKTPLKKAGAYLLSAKLPNGNRSRIVIWLNDTAIVEKNLDNKQLFFVSDSVTGKPIEGIQLNFFGYRQVRIDRNQRYIKTSRFAEKTNADGITVISSELANAKYQWLVIAKDKNGRFAHWGFSGLWYQNRNRSKYDQVKIYPLTDRPVYRPTQTVKYKFWVRNVGYDKEGSKFAKKIFKIVIRDPKGEKIRETKMRTDEFGGLQGEYEIPKDGTLGQYSITINKGRSLSGSTTFRVEEYKKPEYEVTVEAPKKPAKLGDTIEAKIQAKYYFGAPVTNAKVHYKVTRTKYSSNWYPAGRWDWLYGRGYWWFASDYNWYPTWRTWGCFSPYPWWYPQSNDPPEIVLEKTVPINEDGTVTIKIDTSIAKELHGDSDHQYKIVAEVVDQSRRTIVGTGKVLVARKPFKVFAWTDKGHYRSGQTINASFNAQTLDQKPVQGKGKLSLFQISYDEEGKPTENEVYTEILNTDEEGRASAKMIAKSAGQYRISYELTSKEGETMEGGYLIHVAGTDFDGKGYQFNDLELILDKKEYKPGDKVRLMVNTNQAGSTVLIFVRPVNGVYSEPVVLRLDGKSTVYNLGIVKSDMPNFFIEGMTISNGKLHSVVKQVVVPPEKRVVNVEVVPSEKEYKPGQKGTIQLKLTDHEGKPFFGSTVISVYDKSVEYISGGTNISEIRAFFWKWKRHHNPRQTTNLNRNFYNLLAKREIGMSFIGIFGHLMVERSYGHRYQFYMPFHENGGGGFGRRRHYGRSNSYPSYNAYPAAAPMMMKSKKGGSLGGGIAESSEALGDDESGNNEVQPSIRKSFADTALWIAHITPDSNGLISVPITMPENLTTWKIRTWTMGQGTRVGQGEAEVVTTKKLLVRLQAPRFFTEKDEVVLSAIVHNYLDDKKEVRVVLELEGDVLENMESIEKIVTIEANGEARINWRVKAIDAGKAIVRMKALTDTESDAVEMDFPVQVHGFLKMESYTGVIRPDMTNSQFTVTVPEERDERRSRLEIRYSPSLAGAMVDALPYLVDAPYKTTDSVICRFVPTVITLDILKRMKLDLKAIAKKQTNLNSQEIGDDKERAKGWKRFKRNPVFDEEEVLKLAKINIRELTSMQLSDGGWGWFSGWNEHSYPDTTAIVVHGLQQAERSGIALVDGLLPRGVQWLEKYQKRQVELLQNGEERKKQSKAERNANRKRYRTQASNLDAFVYMVLTDAKKQNKEMQRFLMRDRVKLSVYAKAMFGLALYELNEKEMLATILENIEQFVVQDEENQTAYLKTPDNYWWFWYNSEVEANSYYLKLLVKTDPKGKVASRLVKYLLNNRKHATYWSSTRDTATAIEAIAEYLKASGESEPDLNLEIWIDGKKMKEVKINADNFFTYDNKLVLEGDELTTGAHQVEIRKTGTGPLYYNAYMTNFTKEDMITKAGLELKVNRKYYRLIRKESTAAVSGSRGQVVNQKIEKYRREEITSGDSVKSGDLIEIELEIDSKNDYEYLVFEDWKAAGFEAVDLRSGYGNNSLGAYMEFRDNRVEFFVRRLNRGKHSVKYRLRAEVPGKFSALPVKAFAMYAPELKGNSDEIKVEVTEAE